MKKITNKVWLELAAYTLKKHCKCDDNSLQTSFTCSKWFFFPKFAQVKKHRKSSYISLRKKVWLCVEVSKQNLWTKFKHRVARKKIKLVIVAHI